MGSRIGKGTCPASLALAFLFCIHAGDLHGQGEADVDAKTSKKHFEQGVKYFKKEWYSRALESFKKSYELRPHWALHYNMGLCYEKLELYAKARRELDAYLTKGREKVPPARKEAILKKLDRLDMMIGELTVDVGVEGAVVSVDGEEVGTTPLDAPVPLDQGEHRIEVSKEGYESWEGTVVIERGEGRALELDLAASASTGKGLAGKHAAFGKREDGLVPDWVPWTGIALGAALLAAGVGTGAAAIEKNGEYEDAYDAYGEKLEQGTATLEDYESTGKKMDNLEDEREKCGKASTGLFIAGGLIGAAAAVLLILDRRKESGKEEEPRSVSIVPFVGTGVSGGASAGFTASF